MFLYSFTNEVALLSVRATPDTARNSADAVRAEIVMVSRQVLVACVGFLSACTAVSAVAFEPEPSSQRSVKWRAELKQAETEVEKTGRPLLLQFTATWCVYCHRMLKDTFTAQDVVTLINQRYIPIQIDADRHPEIVRALRIDSFPSTVIISADKKRFRKISGYKKPRELRRILLALQQQMSRGEVQPVSARGPQRPPQPPIGVFQNRCLVSLVDDRKLVEGRPEFAIRYAGQIVCFASESHRQRFQRSPRTYWPVLDGACPVTQRLIEQTVIGEPGLGVFYDGRVWLFRNERSQALFLANPAAYR